MDFSKIKAGVLDFSSFLVGHAAWLVASGYSIWIALGQQLAEPVAAYFAAALAWLNRPDVAETVNTYALRPLIPALVFFMGVFLLHTHRLLLSRLGQFVPPDLVMHWMPGMRDIDFGRWHYVLEQLPAAISFSRLRVLVEARYRAALEKRAFGARVSNFASWKALAFINAALTLVPSNPHRWTSLSLSIAFSAAATAAAILYIYHSRLASYWAIEDVVRDLIAEHFAKEDGQPRQLTDTDRKAIEGHLRADRGTRVMSFGWNVPLIGSIRILRQTLSRKH